MQHIFIILIVLCTIIIVAPSNLSIIALIGMEVYNSPTDFKMIAHVNHEIWHF